MGLNALDGRSQEEIEDIIGAMADAGYGLEYDDAQGLIAATRRGPNPYDAAQSFEESAVTLSHAATRVSSGSVELHLSVADSFSTSRTSNVYDKTETGVEISPNTDLQGVEVDLGTPFGDPFEEVRLRRESDGAILDTDTSASPGDTVRFETALSGAEDYFVTTYDSGAAMDPPQMTDSSASTASFDIPGGYDSGTVAGVFSFDAVRALETATSGSIVVDWPQPADLYKWDVATYTRTLDSETVGVFVAYDDGTGWTRTNGGAPISRNYSLADDSNISASDKVRIEAELSRSDTSNNPTLDSAYRSWRV